MVQSEGSQRRVGASVGECERAVKDLRAGGSASRGYSCRGSADHLVGWEEERKKKVIGVCVHDRENTEGSRRGMCGWACAMTPLAARGHQASARMRLGLVAVRADGVRL